MRSQRGGNVRRGSSKIDDDFSLEIEAGQFVEVFFRNLQAVANKNQGRGKRCGGMRGARADEGIVGEGEAFRLAVGDKGEGGFGFIDFVLVEARRLVEAVRAGRLEAGFLKLLDGVGLRFTKTFAAGVAPLERIVR